MLCTILTVMTLRQGEGRQADRVYRPSLEGREDTELGDWEIGRRWGRGVKGGGRDRRSEGSEGSEGSGELD